MELTARNWHIELRRNLVSLGLPFGNGFTVYTVPKARQSLALSQWQGRSYHWEAGGLYFNFGPFEGVYQPRDWRERWLLEMSAEERTAQHSLASRRQTATDRVNA